MNTGMLWYDANPKTSLATKVIRAVEYYTQKYGRVPNTCLVNPNAIEGDALRQAQCDGIGGINIRPYRPVLPGHLWIGIEEAN